MKILIVKLHREYQSAKLDKGKYENYRLLCLERLTVLAQKEKSVCKMFLRICKEKIRNGAGVPSSLEENRVWETTTYLPLAYNESSHMVCSTEYVIKTPIRFGQEWHTEKETFSMPEIEEGDYNCLFCHGQKLPVGKRVRQISFLLYATYGTQFETIELDFGKYTRSYILSASDWTEEPLTDEHVVWQSDFISQDEKNKKIQKGKTLYSKFIVLFIR
ncbi:MAG: hypothetical protein J1F02_11420 [Lachnospiraceae bacterium]|nr:hypothetical protein [Lachnospiraceae bacterium]